jgi:hypothetical protein
MACTEAFSSSFGFAHGSGPQAPDSFGVGDGFGVGVRRRLSSGQIGPVMGPVLSGGTVQIGAPMGPVLSGGSTDISVTIQMNNGAGNSGGWPLRPQSDMAWQHVPQPQQYAMQQQHQSMQYQQPTQQQRLILTDRVCQPIAPNAYSTEYASTQWNFGVYSDGHQNALGPPPGSQSPRPQSMMPMQQGCPQHYGAGPGLAGPPSAGYQPVFWR